jgi:ABC-type bacteriocin/lantibiotic exporter with double-glycine peptidase domain
MKNLIKKLIKLLFVVIAPVLAVSVTIAYFMQYGYGYTPVFIIILLMAILSILNAIFFNVFMEKVVLLPKRTTQFGFMIALGFAWENKTLIIFVPFCITELEWE